MSEWERLESTEAMEKKRKREMSQERVSFIPFLDCPSSTCQLLVFCCLSFSSGRWAKKVTDETNPDPEAPDGPRAGGPGGVGVC